MKKKAVEAIYPMSSMQQGMLFHTLYQTGHGSYYRHLRHILRGEIDVPLLKQAWSRIFERHSMLRTQFVWQKVAKPLQVVWQEIALPWRELDWRSFSTGEQEAKLQAYLEECSSQERLLSHDLWFQMTLIRQDEQSYQLIMSSHHSQLDGWSEAILLQEAFQLYEGWRQGREIALPPTRPYRDYIAWLQEQDMAQAERFWRTQLVGLSYPTRLQIDHARDRLSCEDESYGGHLLTLSRQASAQIEAFTRRYQITISTLIQGAWALLLSFYSGSDDVCFGAVGSGRPFDLQGVESMVGLFINTLPVRAKLEKGAGLLSWLQELQERQIEARQYDYCSPAEIQTYSELPPGLPLYESIVVVENYAHDNGEFEESLSLGIEMVPAVERTNFPLVLTIAPHTETLLWITNERRRFDDAAARRMLEHLQQLMQQMIASPNARLSELQLLTVGERRQIVESWNATEALPGGYRAIHQPFEEQALRHPDVIALLFNEEQLSYQGLNARTNQLARYLRRAGVREETFVGLCIERSFDMVIAILAILKAGGVFVPLDPSYPQDRLNYIIEDAGLTFLITTRELQERFSDYNLHCLCLDAIRTEVQQESTLNLACTIEPDNLAYIIYTSGSTGKPKGTMTLHRSLLNLASSPDLPKMQIGVGCRVLQFASMGFDASSWDLLISFSTGATLHLNTRESLMPGYALAELLSMQAITLMALTPSALAAIPPIELPALRTLVTAGESCSPELVEQWSQGRSMHNAYGPTETTIYSTLAFDATPETTAQIGRPIVNTQIYILDQQMRPLSVGLCGELYIGGAGLARGYFKRPDLTAERFVPHPFSREAGARLYRTGDLARYLPDGSIEFLGRNDHQVKIRGFRIELGELQAVLERFPAIHVSYVQVREDTPGDKRLVVYIIPEEQCELRISELRAYLQEKLPAYMVPNAFVVLETFPLTPNGKIDLHALPAPHEITQPSDGLRQESRDLLEMQLSQMYEEILQVPTPQIKSSFLELGGHSLLAIRLMAEIQKRLNVQIPLATFFQDGSVASIADVIRTQGKGAVRPPIAVPLRAQGKRPPLFCVHPANGQVVCFYHLARHLSPEQPVYGLQDPFLYDDEIAVRSIETIAANYIAAMRAIQAEGPYYLGGYSFGAVVAFEMAQQLRRAGLTVELLAIFDGVATAPSEQTEIDETRLLAIIAGETLRGSTSRTIEDIYQELLPLEQEQQLERVLNEIQAAGIELIVSDARYLQGQIRLFKSRLQAAYRYRPAAYEGQITLFRSSEEEQGRNGEAERSEDLGWQQLSTLPLTIHNVQGYHDTIFKEENVHILAQDLQQCLDKSSEVFLSK